MHLWPREVPDGQQKIWRVIKNVGAKFKIYRRIFETSPTEYIKIIFFFIYVDESVGKIALKIPATASSVHFFISSVLHLQFRFFFLSFLQGFYLQSLASVLVNLHQIKRYVFPLFHFTLRVFFVLAIFCFFMFFVLVYFYNVDKVLKSTHY